MVCLGNICRSPLAEGILRDKINKQNLDISVDSAGTIGLHAGELPDSRSIQVARNHNIDITDLRSRKFKAADFEAFDLILAMDENNKTDILELAQNNADKQKVELIMNYAYPKENIAVPDPYYGGASGFENVFQMLDIATDELIKKILK